MSIPHGEDPKYQTMAIEEMFVYLLIKSDSIALHCIKLSTRDSPEALSLKILNSHNPKHDIKINIYK